MCPNNARIEQLPPIILVFGGKLGGSNNSARQMFINWVLAKNSTLNQQVRTPEQFEDWNNFEGYSNLVDFEIDAGHLTKAIVLFSESEGAYAELGSFCTDPVLSERLFVVIARQHYDAPSFIAHGPIKKIETLHRDHSICVLDTLDRKRPTPPSENPSQPVLSSEFFQEESTWHYRTNRNITSKPGKPAD